jgi:hypothetical protein
VKLLKREDGAEEEVLHDWKFPEALNLPGEKKESRGKAFQQTK